MIFHSTFDMIKTAELLTTIMAASTTSIIVMVGKVHCHTSRAIFYSDIAKEIKYTSD